MSFTWSDKTPTNYPSLGMCDVCGVRFTHGCAHSKTDEAQAWLAAYAAVETSRDNVEYFLESGEQPHPVEAAYELERAMNETDTGAGVLNAVYRPALPVTEADEFPF